MRTRLLGLLVFLAAAAASAQPVTPPIVAPPSAVDPTGACFSGALTTQTVSGHLWACRNGAWFDVVAAAAVTGGTCTNQFASAISTAGVPTCTTDTLASAQHVNQGTTTTVLHGNAAGNPSWSAVSLSADVTGSLAASSIASGGALPSMSSLTDSGLTSGRLTYAGTSGLLQDSAAFLADGTGGGNGVISHNATAGNDYNKSFLRVAGTMLDATAGGSYGAYVQVASGTGTGVFDIGALQVNITSGATGTATTTGVYSTNSVAATNAGSYLSPGGNRGGYFAATGAGGASIYNTALTGTAQGSGNSTGVLGQATGGSTTVQNIGGAFYALNASTRNTAVLAVLGSSVVTPVTSAIDATNGSQAQPIITARDNSAALPTTGATATWQVMDGAWSQQGNGVLTNATMTAETQARESGSLIHSYTWSNAQVVALGGVTAGDITVATLPAKTVVKNAYVIILTPDTSSNALSVACGRTSASFIDYIVASDAKAGANTVYGDASAERGTNLTGYDLPSYTGTTTVTCHFIKTTTNLSTVTGSTGRVILETSLVP